MGWTGILTYHKYNRKDVIQRCRQMLTREEEEYTNRQGEIDYFPQYRVLSDSLVGNVHYAALEITYPKSKKEEKRIIASIIITRVSKNEFCYKDLTDADGPYHFDCPKKILDLLTPTDSLYANQWRKACYSKFKSAPVEKRIMNTTIFDF